MICSLVLVRVRVREVVRVAAKLPVVPRPGAEAGRGAAAFPPPPPPPPAALQCTVGEIRVFCPMGVLGVFI